MHMLRAAKWWRRCFETQPEAEAKSKTLDDIEYPVRRRGDVLSPRADLNREYLLDFRTVPPKQVSTSRLAAEHLACQDLHYLVFSVIDGIAGFTLDARRRRCGSPPYLSRHILTAFCL
jgi:hypothetical protein